ncbi:MFS family membrane transporter [Schizosaccharomyces cryophilus OY26]|uniref:MFS family membrane transporter n=1 Tax=Schizosaccharomyces cryophilus (strain OY26 / ATCC MYA-4695 / CBS 11777 / NBRC 106824 / NRRL Y48691) TaxID=653667 RepID=S9VXN8_SCHCR|nr:MFS family membrane transporter [Schizosaccharomyces cryophilus OY26]EPY52323.1 MFS family membrane transporter [Schizosaccharomyces cryophilus OY26]
MLKEVSSFHSDEPIYNARALSNLQSWDPYKPKEWPLKIKVRNVIVISTMTFLNQYGSSVFAPSIPRIAEQFQSSKTVVTLGATLYSFGILFGTLVCAPLSEQFGRRPVYLVGYSIFALLQIPIALSVNLEMFLIFRFFSGVFGSVGISNGSGTLADLFEKKDRGKYMIVYFTLLSLGPGIAPIISGFITQSSIGWRWEFWILLILSGVLVLSAFLLLKETYPPILNREKLEKTGHIGENEPVAKRFTGTELLKRWLVLLSMKKPLHMLITQPILICVAFTIGTIFGILNLVLMAFSQAWELLYNFSVGISGLMYISITLGLLMAVFIALPLNQKFYVHLLNQNHGESEPEFRLPMSILGCLLFEIGIVVFGWTAEYRVFWFVPLIGSTILGAGYIMTSNPLNMYVVDAYGIYSASASAAVKVLQLTCGAIFPLFAQSLYLRLGYGWGCTLLAFILLFCTVSLPLLFFYGKRVRNLEAFDPAKY